MSLVPETTCKDGWKIPSIGRQGACSHHGGVDYHGGHRLLALIGSIVVGRFTYKFFKKGTDESDRIHEKHLKDDQAIPYKNISIANSLSQTNRKSFSTDKKILMKEKTARLLKLKIEKFMWLLSSLIWIIFAIAAVFDEHPIMAIILALIGIGMWQENKEKWKEISESEEYVRNNWK